MIHITFLLELHGGIESRLMPIKWKPVVVKHSTIQTNKQTKKKEEEKTLNVSIALVWCHPNVTQRSSVS